MPQPNLSKLIRSLEEQGCRIRKTRGGIFAYCPDGKTTIGFHVSKHGDSRSIKNIRADVKRAGLKWPEGILT